MTVAATLWTLWLARNDYVFNNRKLKENDFKNLIFIRVAKWGSAANILNIGFSPDWKMNPVGVLSAIHFKRSHLFWSHLKEAYDYICMVDGAWNKRYDGSIGGGIGGKIIQNTGKTVLIFSGIIEAWNIHETEVAAVIFMLRALLLKNLNTKRVVVCTDSTVAINAIYGGLQHSFPHMIPDFDIDSLLNTSVCIKFVPGEINELADQLAVNGLGRKEFFCKWATHWSI